MHHHRMFGSTAGAYDTRAGGTTSPAIGVGPPPPSSTSSSSPPGPQDDDMAAKIFSTSYCPSLAGYHQQSFMRAVNNEGFLDVMEEGKEKEKKEEQWKTCYCILKDGALSVYATAPLAGSGSGSGAGLRRGAEGGGGREEEEPLVVIPLDMVASVRSAAPHGECAFQIVTPEKTWFFCALSKQNMQEWLFAFHRSLAVIVARLVEDKNHHRSAQKGGGDDRFSLLLSGVGGDRDSALAATASRRLRLMEELGHGHGRSLSGRSSTHPPYLSFFFLQPTHPPTHPSNHSDAAVSTVVFRE